ncbi:hypothetical protein [Xenorhabdus bharatensis]|uniref:hypothetical protein n=1 Tax=Xenorhabdus bharatensis TaxID=3136256 RepID=UPI0030F3ECC5
MSDFFKINQMNKYFTFEDKFDNKPRLNLCAHGQPGNLRLRSDDDWDDVFLNSDSDALHNFFMKIEARYKKKFAKKYFGFLRLLSCYSADKGLSENRRELESVGRFCSNYFKQSNPDLITQAYHDRLHYPLMKFNQREGNYDIKVDREKRQLINLPSLKGIHALFHRNENYINNSVTNDEATIQFQKQRFNTMNKSIGNDIDRVEPLTKLNFTDRNTQILRRTSIHEVWFKKGEIIREYVSTISPYPNIKVTSPQEE